MGQVPTQLNSAQLESSQVKSSQMRYTRYFGTEGKTNPAPAPVKVKVKAETLTKTDPDVKMVGMKWIGQLIAVIEGR